MSTRCINMFSNNAQSIKPLFYSSKQIYIFCQDTVQFAYLQTGTNIKKIDKIIYLLSHIIYVSLPTVTLIINIFTEGLVLMFNE